MTDSLRPQRSDVLACVALALAILSLFRSTRPDPSGGAASPGTATANPVQPAETLSPLPLAQGDLDALSQTSANVFSRASRSVVRVEHTSDRRGASPKDDLDLYFEQLPQTTFGSGTVIDSSGLVLTNYHVVRGAAGLRVRGADQISRAASLVGYDALTDLALLRVPDLNLPALPWGDSRRVVSGQLVWAIGNPLGLDQSVSLGVVSAIDRPTLLDSPFQDFLQTDAAINPGSSGGPLLNAQAEVIGVNTAVASDNFVGIGFSLPSHLAHEVCQQLRSQGHVPRGWIGIHLGEVTRARAAVAGLPTNQGAYIESLATGSSVPAVEAGLRMGDICTEFEGWKVSGPLGLIRKIAAQPIGTTAKLSVVRAGQAIDIQVVVQTRP